MALYTPPSLPRTPSSCPMDAPLPSLPTEFYSSWSTWRQTKVDTPLTPPLSTVSARRVLPPQTHCKPVLPPITYFDHTASRDSPVTPPQADDSYEWHSHGSTSVKLPPVQAYSPALHYRHSVSSVEENQAECSLPSPPLALDWFTSSEHRSSQFIAEKICEMICYLWFSSLSPSSSSPSKRTRTAPQEQEPYIPSSNSATASLQFSVSPAFVRFMQKVLETTQVSQSVIVLSLHYIYRMKARNRFTSGQPGSEYRVAIAALMMANKFVDDNTYTNKTWSEVSGIDLAEINKMEKEFLLGIDFGLYVDKSTYDSWLNLLQGLVLAKERELQHWRRSWRPARALHRVHPHRHTLPHAARLHSTSHRARSSSPTRSSPCVPSMSSRDVCSPLSNADQYPAYSTGAKRTAVDAFNTYPQPAPPPSQTRRSTGLTLRIPELEYSSGHSSESSASPMEPLQSLSKLSLAGSPVVYSPADGGRGQVWMSPVGQSEVPQTLVSAYYVDDKRSYAVPQNLYFYALACSPTEENSARKGKLRYHQPQVSCSAMSNLQPTVPMVVQSASASPYDMHTQLPAARVLPPLSEVSRQWPQTCESLGACHAHVQRVCERPVPESVPSAPFANAGPPGFRFYATTTPASPPHYYEASDRYN
ncbi:uncharacterized protein LAESUDRAFT_675644 [Laetiporus sulphureus 93-53]|uniref:Cyclin-like domain-containing protein n=1 Tax=Laetiporus sulphureus 93-53 TaxID=1314785 RepID=A0A165FJC3_9APHY|nr:uncharacterized protein LAESUDRAFT_675644 [Laetiporus sulphureus 93-53]KZT09059.1 hypothetical protein LAESUDRAFT_675644 [Laetiporus sulphureus 93-53]